MIRFEVRIVSPAKAARAEYALGAWAARHPKTWSAVDPEDFLIHHIRGPCEDGTITSLKAYSLLLDGAHLAILQTEGEEHRVNVKVFSDVESKEGAKNELEAWFADRQALLQRVGAGESCGRYCRASDPLVDGFYSIHLAEQDCAVLLGK